MLTAVTSFIVKRGSSSLKTKFPSLSIFKKNYRYADLLCVRVFVCISVCVYMCVCDCVYIYLCVCIWVCVFVYLYVFCVLYLCIDVYLVWVYMFVYMK